MLRTTALAALFLAVASPAVAAEEDTQFWMTATVVAPVADGVSATAMMSQRFREAADVQVVRGSLDWKASRVAAIGGGATYVQAGDRHEWRAHQQLVLTFGQLSFRTQAEEAFRPGAERPQIRLRERAQYSQPIDSHDTLVGNVELLYIARTDGTGSPRVDQWRTALMLQRHLAPHLDGSAGYMLSVSPRHGAPDRVSHAPQVSLTYRL